LCGQAACLAGFPPLAFRFPLVSQDRNAYKSRLVFIAISGIGVALAYARHRVSGSLEGVAITVGVFVVVPVDAWAIQILAAVIHYKTFWSIKV